MSRLLDMLKRASAAAAGTIEVSEVARDLKQRVTMATQSAWNQVSEGSRSRISEHLHHFSDTIYDFLDKVIQEHGATKLMDDDWFKENVSGPIRDNVIVIPHFAVLLKLIPENILQWDHLFLTIRDTVITVTNDGVATFNRDAKDQVLMKIKAVFSTHHSENVDMEETKLVDHAVFDDKTDT